MRKRCIPIMKGNINFLMGGQWIMRIELEIWHQGITDDVDKVHFAYSFIDPEEGNTKWIAHIIGVDPVP